MNLPTFRRKILLPSSALKIEAEGFVKRMVNFSASTRHYVTEESNVQVCLGSLEEGRVISMQCVRVIFHLCFCNGWIMWRHVSFSICLFYRLFPKRIWYDVIWYMIWLWYDWYNICYIWYDWYDIWYIWYDIWYDVIYMIMVLLWYDMIMIGLIWYDVIYDMIMIWLIWYDMIYDMIWLWCDWYDIYDMIYDMMLYIWLWYDIWYDMIMIWLIWYMIYMIWYMIWCDI